MEKLLNSQSIILISLPIKLLIQGVKICVNINNRIFITIALLICTLWLSSCFTFNPNQVKQAQKEAVSETKTPSGKEKIEGFVKTKGNIYREKILLSNKVRCVAADDKNVWVGTDLGVSKFSRKENKWIYYTTLDGMVSDNVQAIALDGNLVWIGTSDGVSRYDISSGKWKTFKKKDGLASDTVFTIAVDGNYVWFGTDKGLNRYDKQLDSWALRSKKDGLSTNTVKSIAIETEYVWIGTQPDKKMNNEWDHEEGKGKPGAGVNRYHRSTDSWNSYSKSDGLVDDKLTTIAVGEDEVWLGTINDGISVYSKTDQTFVKSYTKTDVLSSNKIEAIAVDGSQIWIGTANAGVQRYLKAVNTWVKYTSDDGLANNHVTCMTVFGNEVWFGTYEGGLSRYNKVSNEWTTYIKMDSMADNDLKVVKSDSKGNVWIGTGLGLSMYNPQTKEWLNYQKKDGLITDYVTDVEIENGNIWIGTDRGIGLFDAENKLWHFFGSHEGLTQLFITALAYDEKDLWAGTSRGIFKYNANDKKWNAINFTSSEESSWQDQMITDLAIDKESNLWIGTQDGIWKYDTKNGNGSLVHYSEKDGLAGKNVNVLLVNENDSVYVGTQNGLSVYKDGKWETITLKDRDGKALQDVDIRALVSDGKVMWLGTLIGLVKYDIERNFFETINIGNGLSRCNIRSICLDGDSLWLGTSAGMIQVRKSDGSMVEEYRSPIVKEPFREPSVSNIEFDGDYVWFSNWSASPNGAIIRYDRTLKNWRRFSRWDILHDTKAKAPSVVRDILVADEYVWFATDYGVLRYDKILDTWKQYTMDDGLAYNDISKIIESANSIWAYIEESVSVSRYHKDTGKWEAIDIPPVPDNPGSMDWLNVVETDGADVWVGFWSRVCGIRRYNENEDKWYFYTRKEGLAKTNVEWISKDIDRVWISHGWRGGASYYDKATKKIITLASGQVPGDTGKIIVGDKNVWIITQGRGSGGGVVKYDKGNNEWTMVRATGGFMSDVNELVEDGDYLWMSTFNEGVNRFHMASGTWTNFNDRSGLLQNHPNDRALKVDADFVWVGTPRGLSMYDKKAETWTSYVQSEALISSEVRSVVADERYVWCGTSQGLSRYDKFYGTWTSFRKKGGFQMMTDGRGSWWGWREPEDTDSIIDNNINSLAVDDRYIWVGTKGGASRYDKIANKWDRYSKENGLPSTDIVAVVVDGYDIWAGTSAGLCKYPRMSDDPNAWVTYTSGTEIKPMVVSKEYARSLVSDEIWSIAVDGKNVWVGTRIGVSQYDKGRDTWTTFTQEDGLASNAVSCIAVYKDQIWFGSDSGLTCYDKKTGDWKIFTTANGLSSDRITCVVPDGDYVWFGTFDAGVCRYNVKTKQWETFTKKDGLAHNSVLSIAVDGNLIWFGTNRGLSRYDKTTGGWTVFTQFYGPEDM